MAGDAGCGAYLECKYLQIAYEISVSDTIFRSHIPFNRWCRWRVPRSYLAPFPHSKCSWLNGKSWATSILIYDHSFERGLIGHICIMHEWIAPKHMLSQCVSKLTHIQTTIDHIFSTQPLDPYDVDPQALGPPVYRQSWNNDSGDGEPI